ncbi:MAG: hypothetical protein GC160_04345 [Acidobacteria bacterium]|nr:hypothetical protein [Acidobacteriota bacterium]
MPEGPQRIKFGKAVRAAPFPRARLYLWEPESGRTAPRPDTPLLVSQEVLLGASRHVSEDVRREMGGFLLGNRFRDPNEDFEYLIIDQFAPAQCTQATDVSLSFTTDAWARLADQLDYKFLGKELVGWYHSHPSMGIFLSEYDVQIHDNRFRDSYMVALVLDPVGGNGGFFSRAEGVLPTRKVCEFYELLEEGSEEDRETVVFWNGYSCRDALSREIVRPALAAAARPNGALPAPAPPAPAPPVPAASPAPASPPAPSAKPAPSAPAAKKRSGSVAVHPEPFPEARSYHWLPREDSAFDDASGARPGWSIVVTQEVLRAVNQHLLEDVSRELGGLLLGNLYECPNTGAKYVKVDQYSKVKAGKGTEVSLEIAAEDWDCAAEDLAGKFRGKTLVGWYHSHPGMGPFLSGHDVAIHEERFPSDYGLALVIDPKAGLGGFFCRWDGRLDAHRTADFFEYRRSTEKDESVVEWGNFYREDLGPKLGTKPPVHLTGRGSRGKAENLLASVLALLGAQPRKPLRYLAAFAALAALVLVGFVGLSQFGYWLWPASASLSGPEAPVDPGEPVELRWTTENIESATLDGRPVALEGALQVRPLETTVYTLAFNGKYGGAGEKQITVNVREPQKNPPQVQLSAARGEIRKGEEAKLLWLTVNAVSVRLMPEGKPLPVSGETTVQPSETKEYWLIAESKDGSRAESPRVSVTVTDPKRNESPPPQTPKPIIALLAAPQRLEKGSRVELSWQVSNADTVLLTMDGAKAKKVTPSGKVTHDPKADAKYVIEASGPGGKASESVTVSVVNPPPQIVTPPPPVVKRAPVKPSVSLVADPPTVERGKPTKLRWKSEGAQKLYINSGVGEVAPEGTVEVRPASDTSYTITATSISNIEASASVRVQVKDPAPVSPRILSFQANPKTLRPGETSKLSWRTERADNVTLDGARKNPTDSVSVSPTKTTTFQLIALGPGGRDEKDLVVEVEPAPPTEKPATPAPSRAEADAGAEQLSKNLGLLQGSQEKKADFDKALEKLRGARGDLAKCLQEKGAKNPKSCLKKGEFDGVEKRLKELAGGADFLSATISSANQDKDDSASVKAHLEKLSAQMEVVEKHLTAEIAKIPTPTTTP